MTEFDNDVTADVTVREELPEEELRVCLFSIGEDTYAILVEHLTEIIISQKIFPVPTAPSHVLGVINLRGNIVPIVDIRPALFLQQQTAPGQIVIIKHGAILIGIVVDTVSEVVRVAENSVQAIPPEHGARAGKSRSRFINGLIHRQGNVAALLNIARIIEEIKLS